MTPAEFKSWFEGFTEAFTGCPTKAQWARIKERVGEIDGKPVTEVRYIDHYLHRYWYSPYPQYSCGGAIYGQAGMATQFGNQLNDIPSLVGSFDGVVAMNALGRAEAASLTS